MTKDIVGYEGLYFCNSNGEIFSYPKKTRKGVRKMNPTKYVKTGYLGIDLCKDGKVKRYLTHRIIAKAFLENLYKKPQVNHINGIKTDNRVENLEWSTVSENQLHSIKLGLRTTSGEKNSQSKLTENDVLKILLDKRKYSEISLEYKVSISTISDIKRGYSWTHITKLNNVKKNNNNNN